MSQAGVHRGQDGCLRLRGPLDLETVPALWRQGAALLGEAAGTVHDLDLAAVERTDSAGVALLIDWTRCARETGGDLRLWHVPEQMLAILRASGVESALLFAAEPESSRKVG